MKKVLAVCSAQKTQNSYDRLSGRRFAVSRFYRSFDKGLVGDVSYRELNCDSLCNTSLEAMITTRDLLGALAVKYGFNPASYGSKPQAKNLP
jgi:hypothetical protein